LICLNDFFFSPLSFFDGSHCLFDWLKQMALPSSVLPSKEKKKKEEILVFVLGA
jgi:hypothetical protein